MVEVNSKVVYRIEPFYFNDDYEQITQQKGFKIDSFSKDKFYEYMKDLLYTKEETNQSIAKTYITISNDHKEIQFENSLDGTFTPLPHQQSFYRHDLNYEVTKTKEKVKRRIIFKIKHIRAVAAASHIGMLVYELHIERILQYPLSTEFEQDEVINDAKGEQLPLTPETYEWAVYALRNMHQKKKSLILETTTKEHQELLANYHAEKQAAKKNEEPFNRSKPAKFLYRSFDWIDFTNGVIATLFKDTASFAENKRPGNYALMYVGAIISDVRAEDEQSVANNLFKISRGYKHTYYNQIKKEDVIRPFDNVWWYFSDEGASSFVLEIEDKAAMDFFDTQYTSKWETNYFYMYMLVLIQKFSAIYYTMKTTERLKQSILYERQEHTGEQLEKELEQTRHLYHTILKFQIQSYHEQISPLTHYNELYRQLLQNLRIPQVMKELQEKLGTFHEVIESIATEKLTQEKEKQEKEADLRYQKRQEEQLKERKEREKLAEEKKLQADKQNMVIQTITYLFLPATLATGILGMNIPLIAESKNTLFWAVFFGVIALTAGATWVLQERKFKASYKLILAISFILCVISLAAYVGNMPKNENPQKVKAEQTCEKDDQCK